MISAGELANIRGDFESWMTDQATIERPSHEKTNGSNVDTWETADVLVPCRRRPVTELRGFVTEGAIGDRQGSESYWLLSFPAGTDVQASDRVTLAGRTYEVTGEFDKTTEIQRQVLCVEVK